MKKSSFLILIFILVCNSIGYSQNRKQQFKLKAKSVTEEIYPIEVILPVDYDSTIRYPIVYITDWWYYKEFEPQLYRRLEVEIVIDPIILVGIGTIGDGTDLDLERRRDLTPTHLTKYDKYDSLKIGSRGITGGAQNFLSFIKNELIPVIESQYLSDTLNRGYVGYSYGGLFGTYILSIEPQLFQKYLLGSPSMVYDNYLMIERLKESDPDKLKSVNSIFITVGEKEGGDQLKGFADLRDLFLTMKLPSLNLECIIIGDERHRSALFPTFIKGIRFLYGEK
jgi:predicted alpha/beta superfamily hydrolase